MSHIDLLLHTYSRLWDFSLFIHIPVPASFAPQTDDLAKPAKWAQSALIRRANFAGDKPDAAYCAKFSARPTVIFRSFIAHAFENRLHMPGRTRCSLQSRK
jgi:hypothetical protein